MIRKNRIVAIIILLFALYLGYMDGCYDKHASKEHTTFQD